ncbi:MAG TPA: hypothetical protein VFV75_19885 [Candidatus Polarisedimenticolaceae bacterium]|nr:hypothetical protein [Candidatus Polarisedimenticolaceae bacterium]
MSHGKAFLAVLFILALVSSVSAASRPIEDFVAAQGTYCIDDGGGGCVLFVPPVPNFFGSFALKDGRLGSVDYAGLANGLLCPDGHVTDFGTAFAGTVTERRLKDGRAEVTVNLVTKRALAWAVDDPYATFDYANGPLSFGYRPCDTPPDGQSHALANSFLQLVFLNTAPGAPLPDMMQLFSAPLPGQEPLILSFHQSAEGALRSTPYNTFPEGAPGQLTVVQTGLLGRPESSSQCDNTKPPATCDGFPAERVIVEPAE